MRYSRSTACADGSSLPGGLRRNTRRRPPARSQGRSGLDWPPLNCSTVDRAAASPDVALEPGASRVGIEAMLLADRHGAGEIVAIAHSACARRPTGFAKANRRPAMLWPRCGDSGEVDNAGIRWQEPNRRARRTRRRRHGGGAAPCRRHTRPRPRRVVGPRASTRAPRRASPTAGIDASRCVSLGRARRATPTSWSRRSPAAAVPRRRRARDRGAAASSWR